jgi:hypothetical protein
MGYPRLFASPHDALVKHGNKVLELDEKRRFFTVRQVVYDDSMTPLYTIPELSEKRFESLEDMKADNSLGTTIWDSPILEADNYLKVYKQ